MASKASSNPFPTPLSHAGPPDLKPCNLIPASIAGLPGAPIQNVTLSNITIIYDGGRTRARAQVALENVPERADGYPEFSLFGELPAWGLYCRHVEGLALKNITLRFLDKDFRSALVCDDVKNLALDGLHVLSAGEEPVIVLNHVRGANLHNCQAPSEARELVRTLGDTTVVTNRYQ